MRLENILVAAILVIGALWAACEWRTGSAAVGDYVAMIVVVGLTLWVLYFLGQHKPS